MNRYDTIKKEIQDDPTGLSLSKNRTPAEIAIMLNEEVSKNPKEFTTIQPLWTIEYLVSLLKTNGLIKDSDDPAQTQIEVLTRRSDELSLGDITQGDVEQALK